MKNKAKRIVSALCALAMFAAMVPAAAFAEEPGTDSTPTTTQTDPSIEPQNFGWCDPDRDDLDKKVTSTVPMSIAVGEVAILDNNESPYYKWFSADKNDSFVNFVDKGDGTATVEGVKPVNPGKVDIYYIEYAGPWMLVETKVVKYQITVQEPQKITVSEAIDNLKVTTTVDGNELDENGEAINSTFSFRLTAADSTDVIANLTATIPAGSTGPVELSLENGAETELPNGDYTIAVVGADNLVWQDTGDVVTFTVSSQDVTLTSADNKIENKLATYTVTYDDGIDAPEASVAVPDAAICKYNFNYTVSDVVPTRDGYTFAGWKLTYGENDEVVAMSEGDNLVQPANNIQIQGNVTLTAQWTQNPVIVPGEPGTATVAGSVDIDKTATDLVNDQSNVTLSVGGSQEEKAAYVLFLLDKSTSTDVRDEASKMLKELMGQVDAGYTVNVAVMSFERSYKLVLDWTALNADNYATIEDGINEKLSESGTNIYLGLREAKKKLDALTNVDPSYKHLVLLTDGITYLWSKDDPADTSVYSIYSENISNLEESINAGNDMMVKHHPNYESFIEEFNNMKKWMSDYGTQIADDINIYQHVYGQGQYLADVKGYKQDSTYSGAGFVQENNDYIPGEVLLSHFSANEAAIYLSTTVWQQIIDSGYHAYAIADTTGDANVKGSNAYNAALYPWASNFIYGLSTIGGYTSKVGSDNVSGMFNAVQSSVVYAIEKGTVTDVIGDNFDVAGIDSFKLTVGGVEVPGTVSGNTVTFGDGKYVVTYEPATDTTKERFTWDITTPVESAKPVQLTYTVKLVNKSTAAGNYSVPTNEEATLTYTSTTGGEGSETFPVPTVSYTVEAPAPVQTPATNTTTATGSSKPVEEATPTPTPAAVVVPQTSDDMPLVTLISVAGIAAAAVVVLVVMRRRRKQ